MKKIFIYAIVLGLIVTLSSCKSGEVTDTDGPSVTTDDTSSEGTSAEETSGYIGEIIEKLPAGADDDGLKYHEADDGNLIIVHNDKNAWAFDLKSDKIEPLVDYNAMLTAADIGNRSEDYFKGENTLSLSFIGERENGFGIEFTVTSEDELSEYVVYAFYSFDGGLGDYHYRSITFPKSGEGVTITDFTDFKKLAVEEDNSLFRFAKAIVENDIPLLEELCNVDEGVLAAWEGMEISDFSVTRSEFGEFLEELYLRVNITKSDIEKLPVGNNVIVIREGMMSCDVEFVNPTGDAEEEIDHEAVKWLALWISAYGFNEPEWVALKPDEHLHAVLDFFISKYDGNISDSSAEEFAAFCEKHFYFAPAAVEDEYVTKHGGHGLPLRYYKVTDIFGSSGYFVITVDYYADPMGTVVAYTHKFTLLENEDGTFKLHKTERTYDSGFKSYGWTN